MKVLTTLSIILFFSSAVWADTVTLKNGAELNGVIIEESAKTLTLRMEGGELTFEARLVKEIKKGGLTIQTIEERELQARDELDAANQIRREKLLQFVAGLETRFPVRGNQGEALPATIIAGDGTSLANLLHEDLDSVQERIEQKLERLEDLNTLIERSNIREKQKVKDAVLSELFPNFRTAGYPW